MARKSLGLDEGLYTYLIDHSLREQPILKRLREETANLPEGRMQVAPEQGQFMALLVKLMGAHRCLEVGTFTGYSALAVALALPPGGSLVACDISKEYTDVARRYWRDAGVAERIELRLGPAERSLESMLSGGQRDTFDFAFIDADKASYDRYYELTLALLRPGGLVAIDNVLWGGSVADAGRNDPDTRAIRALNGKVAADSRVFCSLVPIGDGLMLARKA